MSQEEVDAKVADWIEDKGREGADSGLRFQMYQNQCHLDTLPRGTDQYQACFERLEQERRAWEKYFR